MVRHWSRELRRARPGRAPRDAADPARSTPSARVLTALVLVIVLVTKFTHGAWIVVIAMPVLFLLMKAHPPALRAGRAELGPRPGGVPLPSRIHAVVLVSKLHTADAAGAGLRPRHPARHPHRPHRRATRRDGAATLQREWGERDVPVPLTIARLALPRRHRPVLDYVGRIRRAARATSSCVFIPEYVVGHWWEHAAAQPERAPAESTAAVPARRDGDERSVAARDRPRRPSRGVLRTPRSRPAGTCVRVQLDITISAGLFLSRMA